MPGTSLGKDIRSTVGKCACAFQTMKGVSRLQIFCVTYGPQSVPQDLPMLHGVTDITGLDQMLYHDSGLAVNVIANGFGRD